MKLTKNRDEAMMDAAEALKSDVSKKQAELLEAEKKYEQFFEIEPVLRKVVSMGRQPISQYSLQTGAFIRAYPSIAEASRATGIDPSSISRVCSEKQKYAGEFFWKRGYPTDL